MGTPTLRTNALTTLEALKQLLGIDETDTSQDGVLIQLINRHLPLLRTPWAGNCAGVPTRNA